MKKVTFKLSIGFPGATREETFSLDDLGIDTDELEGEELAGAIDEAAEKWASGYTNLGWELEDYE